MDANDREHEQRSGAGISDEARQDRARAEREVAEAHEPGRSRDPHHELANPARDPDASEYPDPYERRPDPRDPEAEDDRDAAPRDPSTSDPQPPRNLDRARKGEGSER